jgi:hypothetical protein
MSLAMGRVGIGVEIGDFAERDRIWYPNECVHVRFMW